VNIYLHELRTYRKNTLLWVVSMCVGSLFMFSLYPVFSENTAAFADLLNNYPQVIQSAFGLSLDSIGTVPGFYSFIVTFFTLCGAVQAMTLGVSVLSRETTGKTVDFLLTRPVARGRVLTAKLLAVFTCVALTSALYVGVSLGIASAVAARRSRFGCSSAGVHVFLPAGAVSGAGLRGGRRRAARALGAAGHAEHGVRLFRRRDDRGGAGQGRPVLPVAVQVFRHR
jgi:hypothetical protein